MDVSSLLIGALLGAALMAAIFIGTERVMERRS